MQLSRKLLGLGCLCAVGVSSVVYADIAPDEPVKHEKASKAKPHPKAAGPVCDKAQIEIMRAADVRAKPWDLKKHLAKNFPDHKISWLMKDTTYQQFVVKTAAKNFGRCNDVGCYLFGAPAAVIHKAVTDSMKDGKHDPAVLGKALGLPAANFEGPLRMMTVDLDAAGVCVRLPVDADPGVWKCQTPEDKDCFKFGGYTSGGVPEIMALNTPVEKTQVEEVP